MTGHATDHATDKPTLLGREPVFYLTLVQAVLGLLLAFGFDLSAAQVAEILAVSAAALGWLARQQVTPVEAPNLPPATLAAPAKRAQPADDA